MVATDANHVPVWQLLRAVTEDIGNNTHRMPWWIDIGTTCRILFQDIILDGAGALLYRYAPLFRHRNIECEQDTGGGINRHRRADAIKRQVIEQYLHIFQARDRNANLAHFPLR